MIASLRRCVFATLTVALLVTAADATEIPVVQSDLHFSTPRLEARVGDTVRIRNADGVIHNISIRGAAIDTEDLGLQKPGEAVAYTFKLPGTFSIVCSIHPRMKLAVRVR